LMHGDAAAADLLTALAGMAVFFAVFAPLTFWLYRRKTAR